MDLVVDANVWVAAFLCSGVTRQLLLDERLRLCTPEHGLLETEQVLVSARVRRRLGALTKETVRAMLGQLTARTRILPSAAYECRLKEALALAPHHEDAPYLAAALHLKIPLWSNDTALKRQGSVLVYTTDDLIDLLH